MESRLDSGSGEILQLWRFKSLAWLKTEHLGHVEIHDQRVDGLLPMFTADLCKHQFGRVAAIAMADVNMVFKQFASFLQGHGRIISSCCCIGTLKSLGVRR